MIKKYKSNATVVEAIQFTGENFDELITFCKDKVRFEYQYKMHLGGLKPYKVAKLDVPGYYYYLEPGDMVVKLFEGTFHPYRKEQFDKIYHEIT